MVSLIISSIVNCTTGVGLGACEFINWVIRSAWVYEREIKNKVSLWH